MSPLLGKARLLLLFFLQRHKFCWCLPLPSSLSLGMWLSLAGLPDVAEFWCGCLTAVDQQKQRALLLPSLSIIKSFFLEYTPFLFLLTVKLNPLKMNYEAASSLDFLLAFVRELWLKQPRHFWEKRRVGKKKVWLENSCASLTPRPHSCVFCCNCDKVCVPGCALALEILQTLLEPSRTRKGRLSLCCALAGLQVTQFSAATFATGMLKQMYVQSWIWWKQRFF